jgi:hypothetical protein
MMRQALEFMIDHLDLNDRLVVIENGMFEVWTVVQLTEMNDKIHEELRGEMIRLSEGMLERVSDGATKVHCPMC